MHLHNLKTKKLVINNLDYSNKDYFKKNIETNRKIVNDLIVSLANETRPKSFMQLGSWYLGEIQALKIYDLEILNYPNSRSYKSIEALAITRGSQNGIKKAEAFEIVKTIHR